MANSNKNSKMASEVDNLENGMSMLGNNTTSAAFDTQIKHPFYGGLPKSAVLFLFVCAAMALLAVIVLLYLYEVACFKVFHGKTCIDIQYSKTGRPSITYPEAHQNRLQSGLLVMMESKNVKIEDTKAPVIPEEPEMSHEIPIPNDEPINKSRSKPNNPTTQTEDTSPPLPTAHQSQADTEKTKQKKETNKNKQKFKISHSPIINSLQLNEQKNRRAKK